MFHLQTSPLRGRWVSIRIRCLVDGLRDLKQSKRFKQLGRIADRFPLTDAFDPNEHPTLFRNLS